MGIEWNFPLNGNGQRRGIADAGIETFKGSEIKSLAREICQNSLDAVSSGGDKTVKVEFSKHKIRTSEIPGYLQYKTYVYNAIKYWGGKGNERAVSILSEMLNKISNTYTHVLKISDYNTTGLAHPYEDIDDGWNSLTKIDGGATKVGDKAGAFGIGKNAPFVNSDFRMVFYRTLNEDNIRASQGVSRFVSFPLEISDSYNTMTTGIGYYGDSKGNKPIKVIDELESIGKRNYIGTDVYVYGFSGDNDWDKIVVKEILENFMISIYKKKLSVTVDGKEINDTTLHKYAMESTNEKDNFRCFYQVLDSPNTKVFTRDFNGLGTLKLSVLVDYDSKLNRRVLITRTSGMRLFLLDRLPKIISCSAILEMEGEKLNTFFREMENPAHDKWDPNRHSKDKKLAKKYYTDLKDWVRNTIIDLGKNSSGEEINVSGLGKVLQTQPEKDILNNRDNDESITDKIDSILIQHKSIKPKQKGFFYGSGDGGKQANIKPRNIKKEGRIDPNGTYSATRNLGGTRRRTKKDVHKGVVEPGGHDTIHIKSYEGEYIELSNVRIIKISPNRYRATVSLPRNTKKGRIEIVAVGENGKSNRLFIKSVKVLSGCGDLKIDEEGIAYRNIVGNSKVRFEFDLFDSRNYAMEVNFYEHN